MKKRKYDYRPVRITSFDYCTLIGVKTEAFPQKVKDYDRYFDIYLFKWNIDVKCMESDEIGYCYQYRLYHKWLWFILLWLPSTVKRFCDALWIYGLSDFHFPRRLYKIIEVKNGISSGTYGSFDFWEQMDKSAKEEFLRVKRFWNEHNE